jgi:hypothetical protein
MLVIAKVLMSRVEDLFGGLPNNTPLIEKTQVFDSIYHKNPHPEWIRSGSALAIICNI